MGKDTVHTTCRTWDQNQGKGLVLKHTLEDSLRPGLNLDRSSYMVLSNDLWRSIPWSWHQKHALFLTPSFGEFKATLAKSSRTMSCILLKHWLRGFPFLTPALISQGTAESSKIRQEDKDSNSTFLWFLFYFTVHLLKRTLQKCEKNGWMEQISGKGFSGTFQLCFPYYPR